MEKTTEVYYWGCDKMGQFGVGDRSVGKTYPGPRCCSFSILIKKISCGDEHTGFIAYNGYLYTMGSNSFGKLGTNAPSHHYASRPILVETLNYYQIIDISCGFNHTGAVTTSGMVFTWGQGNFGQLGTKENDCSWSPVQVLLQYSAKKISCGSRHTAVILENSGKNLSLWGAGEHGQLGNGANENSYSPVIVNIGPVKEVACGAFHTILLTENGEVLATGANTFGQIGNGTKESSNVFVRANGLKGKEVLKIAAGQHSGCVTATGDLYLWGGFSFGEFLTPYRLETSAKITNLSIGIGFGVALDRNGMMWTWGALTSNIMGPGSEIKPQVAPVIELQNKKIGQISCGGGFVMALSCDINFSDKPAREIKDQSEMSTCLDEMRKEIARLQKGTGGLEDLTCKLEQSKIKQGHLHSLYIEEIARKNAVEENLKNLADDFGNLSEKYEKSSEVLEEKERKIKWLEEELMKKEKDLEGTLMKLEVANGHNSVLAEEIKEIPVLLNRIYAMEGKQTGLEKEKSGLSLKVIECLEENTKSLQRIEKFQEEIAQKNLKIQELEKVSELWKEEQKKNTLLSQVSEKNVTKISLLQEEMVNLQMSHEVEIEKFKSLLSENSKEISSLKEQCNEQNIVIKHLKEEIQLANSNLEVNLHSKLKLEKKLSQQQSTNKEIISTIEKELHSRAESIKNLSIPHSKRWNTNAYEHTSDTFR